MPTKKQSEDALQRRWRFAQRSDREYCVREVEDLIAIATDVAQASLGSTTPEAVIGIAQLLERAADRLLE